MLSWGASPSQQVPQLPLLSRKVITCSFTMTNALFFIDAVKSTLQSTFFMVFVCWFCINLFMFYIKWLICLFNILSLLSTDSHGLIRVTINMAAITSSSFFYYAELTYFLSLARSLSLNYRYIFGNYCWCQLERVAYQL